jgi:hypothetical protein
LFQSEVEEKLIRERIGHRSNALLAYEKESSEQNRKISKILGPPEVIVDDVIELEDDIPQLNSLSLPGNNEIRKTSTSSATGSSATLSGCVFNNCSVYFGKM